MAIGTAYRPPWLSVQVFINALSDTISSLSWYDHVILLGDFNINCLNSLDNSFLVLRDFLSNFGLRQHVAEPTHFTSTSDTLLDLICTDANVVRVWVDHTPSLSDHALVACELNIPKLKSRPKSVYFRPIKDIDPVQFNALMSSIDWNALSMGNVNEIANNLTYNLLEVFDYLAPKKLVFIKHKSYPWITHNIRLMIKRRNEAYRKARSTKHPAKVAYYNELKSIVGRAIQIEKDTYFKTYVSSNVRNPRTMWKHIKENVNFKRTNDTLPTSLCDPDRMNRDVTQAIRELRSNAIGIDDISLDMLTLWFDYISGTLATLINKSISSSIFPSMWRDAVVRPIPKISSPLEFKDLRPISILPCTSKILEKVICRQLVDYLERNDILPKLQSGFRRHHSTATALVSVLDDVIHAQDDGKVTIMVLLDFSRAFDAINIGLLLAKLRFYGLEEAVVSWFASYLQDRHQIVEIRNERENVIWSQRSPLVRGVPQGSILGPILFSIYSGDVIKSIRNCRYHIYADDIQIYLSFKPHELEKSLELINSDLERIFDWSKSNALVLNPNKTKYIVLGTRHQVQLVKSKAPSLEINGSRIEGVCEVRNLGLLLDENMRFESHVSNIVRTCFYRLKVLYRIRDSLDEKLRIALCETLVLSKFNYIDVVIGPRLLERTKKSIQRVQNACARYCFYIPRRDHVTSYLNQASILKMKNRRRLHLATMLFGVIKHGVPTYLVDKLEWRRNVNTAHCTRSSQYALSLPMHRTAAFRGSFKYAATKCWNNLPPPLHFLSVALPSNDGGLRQAAGCPCSGSPCCRRRSNATIVTLCVCI
ncbi:uncharacterized protein LOC123655825 [Melitaea cinxia]|uniref:uncharacterized protein LOC123655825 n=1 Tax=Melitaea cinxia TaxID=113334 RepID=UPI001E2749E5|nr:uncharacterized protein LOC123655825 [Melitaea cinxia]